MPKSTILLFTANPYGTSALALDEEAREISQKIRLSEHRDSLELVTRWATRADDLLQSLNEYRPVIVQFSGHGSNTEEILLQDASRAPQAVSKAALKQLFSTCKDNIRVVVLNACYSRPQAQGITEVIDCAIGMKKSISDDAARTFAASFYRAIGFGRSMKEAFEQGKTALMLEGIPEAQTPDLLVRAGVDPAEVILAAHNREVVATIEYESEVDSSAATFAAVAQLAELGWTVRPGDNDILFEVANRALPPMKESAAHFTQVKKPFTLHFRSIKSLDGLHYLAGIKNCSKIEINAGEFTDISELLGFDHLTSLIISQVPLNGIGIVDASILASLTNLELLNLNGSRVRFTDFLAPLKKLKALNLGHTLVADLSSISGTSTLVSLEIRETRITDLTPLVDDQSLAELKISNEQVPGLVILARLKSLKRIVLIDQRPADLTPIGSLSNLESISIWGLPQFDLAPLGRLSKLQNLQLSAIGFDRGLSGVRNLEAMGDLNDLKTLTLGQLEVNNLSFAENLRNVVELNLRGLPILSLASVRGLSSLRKISLVDIPVVDISPLLELPQLSELFLLRVPARVDVLTELKRRGVRVTP